VPDAEADGVEEALVEVAAFEVLDAAFAVLELPVLLPQFPPADWHPVPQYADVDPHQPFELQQLPKVLPTQVLPVVPPQVPSVDTFLVDVGAAEDEVFVEEAAFEDDTALLLLLGLLLPQFPYADWQPVPQYADVEPHQPLLLQQFPKVLPRHVYLLAPPQVASVLTFWATATDSKPAVKGRRNLIVKRP
jgi:hypothetical protein